VLVQLRLAAETPIILLCFEGIVRPGFEHDDSFLTVVLTVDSQPRSRGKRSHP
jgi:hypothetical protein